MLPTTWWVRESVWRVARSKLSVWMHVTNATISHTTLNHFLTSKKGIPSSNSVVCDMQALMFTLCCQMSFLQGIGWHHCEGFIPENTTSIPSTLWGETTAVAGVMCAAVIHLKFTSLHCKKSYVDMCWIHACLHACSGSSAHNRSSMHAITFIAYL